MLTIHNLNRYVGNQHIIKNLNVSIPTGQAVGIVWPNWCGKTSFINLINWFNHPQHWSLVFNQRDITKDNVEQRAILGIWRVFQSFGIFKNLTLEENLALAFVHKLRRWQKRWTIDMLPLYMKDQITDILKDLDLVNQKKHRAWSLSGWQMRLLEIARLILQDTSLYLLDEPTAWVSPKLKSKVIALLKRIISQKKTVLIVEHDFEFLWWFVDKIFVMNDGKIVTEGTYTEIKQSDMVQSIYFGNYSK